MWWPKLEIECIFLKFAFPCTFIKKQRGEISKELYDKLEHAAYNDIIIPRALLEKTYYKAFEWIKELAKEKNKEYWDADIIKEYFVTRHNQIIKENQGIYAKAPNTLKELCRVQKAKIIKHDKEIYVASYDTKKRPVMSLIKNVAIGDSVLIHYGYVVQKIE